MEETSYEGIRDHSDIVPSSIREQWQKADLGASILRQEYQRIADDNDLNDEAKERRTRELYERRSEVIARQKSETKEALAKASRSSAEWSIPRPEGQPLSTSDPTKLLLAQNESARVLRGVERRKSQPGPLRQDTSGYLREEYKRGIAVGGVEGSAICSGVRRAASELGIDDSYLPRSEQQQAKLDESRRLKYYASLISTTVPRPPAPKKSSGGFTQSGNPIALVANRKTVAAAPARRRWK
jgi:hypothetical protein